MSESESRGGEWRVAPPAPSDGVPVNPRSLMHVPPKSNVMQGYQVVLYSKPLHPDLFQLKGRKVVRDGDYELEAWVLAGQHALRFEHRTLCVSELVTDTDRGVPQQGIVSAFLCNGERDFEHEFAKDRVNYMTTVQTESLSESLYAATYTEMLDFARQNQALTHRWRDEVGNCLSIIDIQRMNREAHVQAYHMVAAAGLVLRTQTIFEVKAQKPQRAQTI